MAHLPDRFDLWVRKARGVASPARQVDLILGALVAAREWYFLNAGTKEQPRIEPAQPAEAAHPAERFAVVFSDAERIKDFAEKYGMLGGAGAASELPAIVTPTPSALDWCVESNLGLLINPDVGETVLVPPGAVASFAAEWRARGGRQAAGFWIPSMTSEEEDFWQEHGV